MKSVHVSVLNWYRYVYNEEVNTNLPHRSLATGKYVEIEAAKYITSFTISTKIIPQVSVHTVYKGNT